MFSDPSALVELHDLRTKVDQQHADLQAVIAQLELKCAEVDALKATHAQAVEKLTAEIAFWRVDRVRLAPCGRVPLPPSSPVPIASSALCVRVYCPAPFLAVFFCKPLCRMSDVGNVFGQAGDQASAGHPDPGEPVCPPS